MFILKKHLRQNINNWIINYRKGISRNEIPLVNQNLFNKIMYKEQIIYLNKLNTDIQIGKILKLNNQDNCLYGIISEQTILNIYTSSSDFYFIVEISINTFLVP